MTRCNKNGARRLRSSCSVYSPLRLFSLSNNLWAFNLFCAVLVLVCCNTFVHSKKCYELEHNVCLPSPDGSCAHCHYAGGPTSCYDLADSRCVSFTKSYKVENWGINEETLVWEQNFDLRGNYRYEEAVCRDRFHALCFKRRPGATMSPASGDTNNQNLGFNNTNSTASSLLHYKAYPTPLFLVAFVTVCCMVFNEIL